MHARDSCLPSLHSGNVVTSVVAVVVAASWVCVTLVSCAVNICGARARFAARRTPATDFVANNDKISLVLFRSDASHGYKFRTKELATLHIGGLLNKTSSKACKPI